MKSEFDRGVETSSAILRDVWKYGNGDIYTGQHSRGVRNGQGTMVFARSNDSYEGQWLNDNMHGMGVYTFGRSKDVYRGEFLFNKRNGQGTLTRASGEVYTGAWRDDKRCGRGEVSFKNGNVVSGEWSDDALVGKCTVWKHVVSVLFCRRYLIKFLINASYIIHVSCIANPRASHPTVISSREPMTTGNELGKQWWEQLNRVGSIA